MTNSNYPLISVIVPVYNVEQYLSRCVDSILAQTYPNIEIILVNDGSTDNSQIICEKYVNSFPHVRALKKNNGGLSSARNFGLNSAKGEYVGFVDSDDWISPDMYMSLFNLIKKNQADASQINVMLAYRSDIERKEAKETIKIVTGRDNILYYYLYSGTRGSGYSICRCLFPLGIAKKYKFREGKVNEDIDYKFRVLGECNRFVSSDKVCYYYYQSGNSITTGILKKRDFELYEAAQELQKLTNKETNEKIKFLGNVKVARTPFALLCRAAYYGIDDSVGDKNEIIKRLVSEHRSNLFMLLRAPLLLNRKIIAVALAINFNCVSALISLFRK